MKVADILQQTSKPVVNNVKSNITLVIAASNRLINTVNNPDIMY